jgi:hypothetical protein
MTISEPAVILGVGTAVLPDICHALGLPTAAKVKKPAHLCRFGAVSALFMADVRRVPAALCG